MISFENNNKQIVTEKTVKRSIATDSFMLIFVQCVTMLVGIGQVMILSRAFSKEEYGTYSQALMIISLITPFLLLGLSSAVNYFFNSTEEKLEKKKYLQSIFGLILFFGVLGGVGIILSQQIITNYYSNPALKVLIGYVAFRPLLQNLIAAYYSLYISAGMTKTIAIRNLVISFAQIAITAFAAFLFHDIIVIFVMLFIMDVVQLSIFAMLFSKKQFKFSWFPKRKDFFNMEIAKKILGYAIPLGIATMIGTITINIDKLFVGRLLSVEDFALFSNMAKELPFSFIVVSFTAVVTPVVIALVAKKDKDGLANIWANYFEIGYIMTWTFCIGAIICAPELLDLLYSEKYASGLPIFIVYILIVCIRVTYYGLILTAYGKTKMVLFFSAITVVLNFILNIAFFQLMGMIGLAIASFISTAVTAIMQLIYGSKISGIKLSQVICIKQLFKFLIVIIFAASITLVVKFLLNNMLNNYIILAICYGMFVFLTILFTFKRLRYLIMAMNSVVI